jgi:hypothetical protein
MTEPTRARLRSQLLTGEPARRPEDVAARLLAIQGQDPRGARLAIRARSTGLTVVDVDRALTVDRSLVVTWLNRGTLHMVRTEDYPLLQALTAPRRRAAIESRLAREGMSPAEWDRGVAVVVGALEADGPLVRAELRRRLAEAGVRSEGQATIHVLSLASQRGLVVRGPIVGREQAFALTRDWLDGAGLGRGGGTGVDHLPAALDRDVALAELARRYLAGHGPATADDLAAWAGIALGEAWRGLRAIGDEIEEWPEGMVDVAGRGEPPELPAPRLLGPFDPVLHGWKSRGIILGRHTTLITNNGMFHPFALVGGRAVARWRFGGGHVGLEPLEEIEVADLAALETDGEAVARWFRRAT